MDELIESDEQSDKKSSSKSQHSDLSILQPLLQGSGYGGKGKGLRRLFF